MAWTAPRTWVVGEIATATQLNAHLRDNLLETETAKAVAAGDLFYATAPGTLARLAKGAADTWLTGGASAPSFATAVKLPITHKQYLPGSDTTFTRSATTFADVDATNLAVAFTVPKTGKVLVVLSALATAAQGGSWNLRDASDDVADTDAKVLSQTSGSGTVRVTYPVVVSLTPGASKTLKWGYKSDTSGQLLTLLAGPTNGPMVIEVWGWEA